MSAKFDPDFRAAIERPPIEVYGEPQNIRHFTPGPTITFTITTKVNSEQDEMLVKLIGGWSERGV